jgi:phage-related protein
MYEIVLYEDSHGNSPIEQLIQTLDRKAIKSKNDRIMLKQIRAYIDILQRVGTRAGEPFTKYIKDSLWELRPGKNRILFFYWRENTFVLLHSFIKKTQKTPKKEIEKAQLEIKDWLERSN